jgi:UDP-glucose-4-epimerase GalE
MPLPYASFARAEGTFLVTGGAGFVGGHTVMALRRALRETESRANIVVVDSLEHGHADVVPDDVQLEKVDLRDAPRVRELFHRYPVRAVMHFAGLTSVAESVRDPGRYAEYNVRATTQLFEAALDAGVSRVIFSSSAAVYGAPTATPLVETAACAPVNPYGETKLAVERWLAQHADHLGSISLRYFNAAGASFGLRERHDPETHLLPLAIDAALGRHPALALFGTDYPTPDGTAVRDYVHVADLADAHVSALVFSEVQAGAHVFNLGAGRGHSVRDVLHAVAARLGRSVPYVEAARRAGDPPELVADITRAREALAFSPSRSDLSRIVADAATSRGAP